MTTDPRFCVACRAPIPPGSEVCANCGAYQYASAVETPQPYQQYHEPFQAPTGIGADAALQAAPGQYARLHAARNSRHAHDETAHVWVCHHLAGAWNSGNPFWRLLISSTMLENR